MGISLAAGLIALWSGLALPTALPAAKPAIVALRKTALSLPGGKKVEVEVADSPSTRERGLMYRRNPKDCWMLFVFSQPMALQFWMKNTFVSLDIVYIGSDKRITRVHEKVMPSVEKTMDEDVARVGGFGQYVLELPAGTARRLKLKEGQALGFSVGIPER
ncbi:MAG: DUF192 domain-containing protein [Elusimicrobia bacterium]|nr:DUF192 domain-containing protein [Elusimicrobiota bacterium]